MMHAGVLLSPATFVGDDVVDLDDPDTTHRADDDHFLARILTAPERALLQASDDPTRLLWKMWTAKQAAYKVLLHDDWDLPFAPRALAVSPIEGTVDFGGEVVAVCWRQIGAALACVGWRGNGEDVYSALEEVGDNAQGSLTPRELASVNLVPSFEARLLAKRMVVERLGARWRDVELVRPPRDRASGRAFGPPEVWVCGEPVRSVTVSLSHHGRYVGCAIGAR